MASLAYTGKLSWDELGPKAWDELVEIYRSANNQISDEVMERYNVGMKRSSLEAKLRVYASMVKALRMERGRTAAAGIPPSPSKRYNDFMVRDLKSYIVISDVEAPDHSALTLKRAIQLGMAHGIKHLIIAGDFIATNQLMLNAHEQTWRVEQDTSYEQDLNTVDGLLYGLGEWFDVIDMFEGNHDHNVSRKTGGEIHLGMFIKQHEKITYSRYEYMWVKSPIDGEYTLICHPHQYSANSVVLGRKLYNSIHFPHTRQKPKRLVVAHTHQNQTGFSEDGLCEIYGLGTCRDPERTKYVSKGVSTHPKWKNAFLMVKDDFAYNVTEHSNWKELLGDFYTEE